MLGKLFNLRLEQPLKFVSKNTPIARHVQSNETQHQVLPPSFGEFSLLSRIHLNLFCLPSVECQPNACFASHLTKGRILSLSATRFLRQ